MIARFSKEKFRDPSQPFFAVKQTGSVAQYIHLFEDLSTQVSGLTDRQLDGIFMNGLQHEMKEVVNMCKPVDLAEMISTAYQMEDSVMYKVVCRERQQEGKYVQRSGSTRAMVNTKVTSSGNYKSPQAKQTKNQIERPQLKLSEAQIAEKKHLGLCFTCDEKSSRLHWCLN